MGFRAYLAHDAIGTGRSQIDALPSNATTVDLPSNTLLGSFSHVLVYTFSDLAEQTTPVATLVEDAGLVVSEAQVDKVLDP